MRIRVTEGCMAWGVDIDNKDFLFSCSLRQCADAYEALVDKYAKMGDKESLIGLLSTIAETQPSEFLIDVDKTINDKTIHGTSVLCEFNSNKFDFFRDEEEYDTQNTIK